MNIKDSIGLRIKTERERQQMSREVLCLDGAELTVRQLIRIEKGESLPSLDRLSYIAKRLGKSMTELLDQDNITIPDEYYEMKNRLIKFPTYRNPDRIKSKLTLIEEVYEKFFDILPEEELLTYEKLEVLGIDSVIIEKIEPYKFSIDFRQIGTFDEFQVEHNE